ncbi:MAG: DUF177 domain-containing protein [Alphaproteobacteria bacterium]|nr:DUF177 domain-containing protein [Alphaproteobacteria bacterium]
MAENAPFSRPVRVESVPEGGLERLVEADEGERAAVARLNGLPAIARLEGKFTLRRAGRGMIRVTGEIRAEVTQTCVVSLEPLDVVVDEPVDVRFAPPAGSDSKSRSRPAGATDDDGAFGLSGEDEPDPIVDGAVDLGALAAEFMVLALDPYPRKPGVEFHPPSSESEPPNSAGAPAKKR